MLVSSLDYSEMSQEEIIELIELVGDDVEIECFNPRHSQKEIKVLIQSNKVKDDEIRELMKKLDDQNVEFERIKTRLSQIEEQTNEIENIKTRLSQIEEQTNEIVNIKTRLSQIEGQCSSEKVEIKEMRNEFSKFALVENLTEIESTIKKEKTENEKKIREIYSKLDQIEKNSKNEIEKLHSTTKQLSVQKQDKPKALSFPFTGSNEFKGIINYLNSHSNGNICNLVDFTASSNNNESEGSNYWHVSNISLFWNDEKGFFTKDIPGSWICLDFKDHKIIPTAYTYKTCKCTPFPKSWVVEVSNDKNNWQIVDEQKNCSLLNGRCYHHTFENNKPNANEFRYIRIRLIESWGTIHLGIGSLEIYGTYI